MGLDDALRKGILTANKVTGSLQVNVVHKAWIDSDVSGEDVFDTEVSRPAVVEYRRKLVRNDQGEEVVQHASITFLRIVEPNGATSRREPIDPRDELTLPDGHTGPILSIKGVTDPDTSRPYVLEVSLG